VAFKAAIRTSCHRAPALWASRVVSSLAYWHSWFMRSLRSARDAFRAGAVAGDHGQMTARRARAGGGEGV